MVSVYLLVCARRAVRLKVSMTSKPNARAYVVPDDLPLVHNNKTENEHLSSLVDIH